MCGHSQRWTSHNLPQVVDHPPHSREFVSPTALCALFHALLDAVIQAERGATVSWATETFVKIFFVATKHLWVQHVERAHCMRLSASPSARFAVGWRLLALAQRPFMQELAGAVGVATVKPGTKLRKLVALAV